MLVSRSFHILFDLTIIFTLVNSECPNIITKKQWGGKLSKEVDYIIIPVKNAIIEHTATGECSTLSSCIDIVTNIQNHHVDNLQYHDIGYNFLIGGDGNVYEGAGWHKVGAHTYGWNSKSLGIAFIGDFSDKLPTHDAMTVAKKLLECGVQTGELDPQYKLLGHKQIIATASPGARLYLEITSWPNFSQP